MNEGSDGSHPRRWLAATHLSLLVVLGWLLFFHRLADRDLWNSHEARAAQDAQSILDEGPWGLPHLFDGRPELQKPPLYYWLVALLATARGTAVDAETVRLPAALAGLGCTLAVYWFAFRRGRPIAGFAAAAVLATAMHYTWLARVARIDLPLTFAVTISLLLLDSSLGLEEREKAKYRRGKLILAYCGLALALLLKGPIGGAFVVAVMVGHLLTARLLLVRRVAGCMPAVTQRESGANRFSAPRTSLSRRLGLAWGIPLVLALSLPWYCWANVHTHGQFFQVFFWHHNIERGFGGADDLRAHPWWFYGPEFVWDFLPWSPLLLLAAAWCWRRRRWSENPEARFGMTWLVAVIVLLSCMRFKRADYLLPAYPGAALFLGSVLEAWYQAARRRVSVAAGFGCVVLACVFAWMVHVHWSLPKREPERDYRRFAEQIRLLAPPPQPVLFFRTEAHALAFHVGRPLRTFVEWESLDALAGRPEPAYVVMPLAAAGDWQRFVKSGRLEEVLRNTDLAAGHEKPLVLLRTRPCEPPSPTDSLRRSTHARATHPLPDCDGTAQRSVIAVEGASPARNGAGGVGGDTRPAQP